MPDRRAWLAGLLALAAGWWGVRQAEAEPPGLKILGGGGLAGCVNTDRHVKFVAGTGLTSAQMVENGNSVLWLDGSSQVAGFGTGTGIGLANNYYMGWGSLTTYTGGALDTGFTRSAAGVVLVTTGALGAGRIAAEKTLTSYGCSGVLGAVTINAASGQAVIANGASSVVVTNSLVTSCSVVMAVLGVNDATALYVRSVSVVPGSFTITVSAVATAGTCVRWWLVN